MSVYALQKLLRDVNRIPERREAYFRAPAAFAAGYELTERERDALLGFDVRALYEMGVHGLILRSRLLPRLDAWDKRGPCRCF